MADEKDPKVPNEHKPLEDEAQEPETPGTLGSTEGPGNPEPPPPPGTTEGPGSPE
jgi:hypothetical protein